MNDVERRRIFDRILGENAERIQNIARRNAAPGCAEDLRQEILMELWRSLDRYKGESTLRTWFYSVASYTVLDFKHRRRRQEMSAAAEQEILAGRFASNGNGNRPAKALDEFVASRDAPDRQVFTMYLDGYGYREISAQTLVAEATLRKRVQRMKEQLKAQCGR
jgi:RNA polymerase sigma-70 factor (ECF subfamily)